MKALGFNIPKISVLQKKQSVKENQQNPFTVSFKNTLSSDKFEKSNSLEKNKNQILPLKAAEHLHSANVYFKGLQQKLATNFKQVQTFTSSIAQRTSNAFNKLNSITVYSAINNVHEQLFISSHEREVQGLMKRPVSELSEMLSSKLTV